MAKIKNVAVQMDHVSTISIAGDSTFAMSLEAQTRGYSLFHYTPDRLSLRDGTVYATVEPMELRDVKGDHYTLGEAERVDLSTMDVVLLRQDPPFDMSYITSTHHLERIHPQTLVVNDPAWVRNSPEIPKRAWVCIPPPMTIRRRRPSGLAPPEPSAGTSTGTRP